MKTVTEQQYHDALKKERQMMEFTGAENDDQLVLSFDADGALIGAALYQAVPVGPGIRPTNITRWGESDA